MRKLAAYLAQCSLIGLLAVPASAHWSSISTKEPKLDPNVGIIPQTDNLDSPEFIPESRWLSKIQTQLTAALPDADTLLLPPQVQAHGFSRPLRGAFGETPLSGRENP